MISRLKACLNGTRPAVGVPLVRVPTVRVPTVRVPTVRVPATPAELAAAGAVAVEAGAEALHVHPRSADGRESLAAGDVEAALTAIRAACPGVPVGVSTGLWITGQDAARRAALVAAWTVRPDFASVNVHEEGFEDLVRHLAAAGVGVEAGVWSPSEVDRLAGLPIDRVLIEIIGTPAAEAVPAADAILARLDDTGSTTERLLHGEEDACWPLVAYAGLLGLPTRIGLEDTLTLPDGTVAADNAVLVRRALRLWTTAF